MGNTWYGWAVNKDRPLSYPPFMCMKALGGSLLYKAAHVDFQGKFRIAFSPPLFKRRDEAVGGVNSTEPTRIILLWERGELGMFAHSVDFSVLRGVAVFNDTYLHTCNRGKWPISAEDPVKATVARFGARASLVLTHLESSTCLQGALPRGQVPKHRGKVDGETRKV